MFTTAVFKGISALALAGIIGGAAVTPALAGEDTPNGLGGHARRALFRAVLHEVAEQTGLERCDLLGDLAEGQTLNQIVQAAGVDPQEIVDAVIARVEARLDRAVEAGRITQEQADALLTQAQERIPQLMEADLSQPAGRLYERVCTDDN